jgi:hypothetical protein
MNAVPPVRHGTENDIKEATDIYRDFLNRVKTDPEFVKLGPNDKITYYHRNSPTIVGKFPVVFRYMMETGQFHPKALKMYFDKLKAKPYKSEEEYCERNADYIKYLYMQTHAHYNRKEANQLWADAKKSLLEELQEFKDRLDTHRKNAEDMKNVNAYERREELKRHIEQMAQGAQSTKT